MSKKYGLLLDFDGVVVDSEPLYEAAMNIQFKKYDIEVEAEDWLFFKGKDAKAVFSYIRKKYDAKVNIDEMRKEYSVDLFNEFKTNMRFIPGFKEFYYSCLDEFSDMIVTSTSREVMDWTFENVPVDNIFSGMITSNEVENTKPHPEPYLKGAEKIGIPIENCIVIEDSVNGIRAGKASGAKVIGITTTFPSEIIHEADLIVSNYSELSPEVLKELIDS
ncbi:MAG: HAD family phosphatase [Candidatus Marinimicrobia bacterium]|nr:HAD family phosphatase [Candidatus Neomarinimicrobiota bacterium]